MKEIYLNLFAIIFCVTNCFSQDTIIKYSGDTILAKILEVSPTGIKYKAFNNLAGPMDSVSAAALKMIIYENGLTQAFNDTMSISTKSLTNSTNIQLFEKGRSDALIYYKDKGPGVLTIATNIYPLPILGGLITAAICNSVPPRERNLSCPFPDLMRNPDYKNGYTQKALEIKKHRVWRSWGISSGCIIVTFFILVTVAYSQGW